MRLTTLFLLGCSLFLLIGSFGSIYSVNNDTATHRSKPNAFPPTNLTTPISSDSTSERQLSPTSAAGCSGPFVVGGLGGSGTRLTQKLLAAAGVFMGAKLNQHGDNTNFMAVDPVRSIKAILAHTQSPDYTIEELPSTVQSKVQGGMQKFRQKTESELAAQPGPVCNWGWKGPRQMYYLPWLLQVWPNMHFVYVARDVRDLLLPKTSFGAQDVQYARLLRPASAEPVVHPTLSARVTDMAHVWAVGALGVLSWCGLHPGKCTVVKTETLLFGGEQGVRGFFQDLGLEVTPEQVDTLLEASTQCYGAATHKCTSSEAKHSYDHSQLDPTEVEELLALPQVQEAMEALRYDLDDTGNS